MTLLDLLSDRAPDVAECVARAAKTGWETPLGRRRFVVSEASVRRVPRHAWRFMLRLVMREPAPAHAGTVAGTVSGTDDANITGWTAAVAARAMAASWPGLFAPCDDEVEGDGVVGSGLLKSIQSSLRAIGGRYGTASGNSGKQQVGFYLQMAHEPKASLEVIKSVRKHFPDAPIAVVSDAGWDCAGMCEKYSCVFRREERAAGMHGRGGVTEWIKRIRAAADWSGTPWLVLLEDDVRVDGPITRWPSSLDAGGVEDHRWTAPLKPELIDEIRRRTGALPGYAHYGLCGGAIIRTSALRDTPDIPVGVF